MVTVSEVEALARGLSENQRAILAGHLLESLSSTLHDEDEGMAEAKRRDTELDENPAIGMSLQQLDEHVLGRQN